jgi:hypothetical protein
MLSQAEHLVFMCLFWKALSSNVSFREPLRGVFESEHGPGMNMDMNFLSGRK